MMKFEDYFKNKIIVNREPDEAGVFEGRFDEFDTIINVTDMHDFEVRAELINRGKDYYWFPSGEVKGVSLDSMFACLSILKYCYENNKKVYLHCSAGVNRSPTMYCSFYRMITNKHLPEDYVGNLGTSLCPERKFRNRLLENIKEGYLPCEKMMNKFIGNISHGSIDYAKIQMEKYKERET